MGWDGVGKMGDLPWRYLPATSRHSPFCGLGQRAEKGERERGPLSPYLGADGTAVCLPCLRFSMLGFQERALSWDACMNSMEGSIVPLHCLVS